MIRSTSHSVKFANPGKQAALHALLNEARRVCQLYVDWLWENPYSNQVGTNVRTLDIKNGQLDCPAYMDYRVVPVSTDLSARMLCSISNQALGMIGAAIEKQRRRIYKRNQLVAEGLDTARLDQKIQESTTVRPTVARSFRLELSSKNTDFIETSGHFEGFLRLKSLGTTDHLKLPIRMTRMDRKWQHGRRLNSFLISDRSIDIRYEIPDENKQHGITVGVDQGISTLLQLSDGQTTDNIVDPHLHTARTIYERLKRQRRGSRANRRTQQHLKNYLGYCLNRLDFSQIKQLNLEDAGQASRFKSHHGITTYFAPGYINRRIAQKAAEQKVSIRLVDCSYRSQRCSVCGWVQKSNRKGKQFKCGACLHSSDADLNAAINLATELPFISADFRRQQQNLQGFYWNAGQEPEFLIPQEENNK